MAAAPDTASLLKELISKLGDGTISPAEVHAAVATLRPVGIPEAIATALNSSVAPLAEDSPSAAAQAAALDILRVVTRGSSNLYLKYEENNALLSRVASCALVATKNSDRSVRTEAFRVLSVIMHKYHLFAEKYLSQLFGAVADELERHEHNPEGDRALVAAVGALDGARELAKSISFVRAQQGKLETVHAVTDADAAAERPQLTRAPSFTEEDESTGLDGESKHILQTAAGSAVDRISEAIITIISGFTGGDAVNLPEDVINKVHAADEEFDNTSFTTPFMACVDCFSLCASIGTERWRQTVLDHPMIDESSPTDTIRDSSTLLISVMCQTADLSNSSAKDVFARTWQRIVVAVNDEKESNPEVLGTVLWSAQDMLDKLCAIDSKEAVDAVMPFVEQVDAFRALYTKLTPYALGEKIAGTKESAASAKVQSFALSVIARMALLSRSYRMIAQLPPLLNLKNNDLPELPEEVPEPVKKRIETATELSSVFLDAHSTFPGPVKDILRTYTAPGASVAYRMTLHAMELLVSLFGVTLREPLKEYCRTLLAWTTPALKEATDQISSMRFPRPVGSNVKWHHYLKHPDFSYPADEASFKRRLLLLQNLHDLHSLFGLCSGAASVLRDLASADVAEASEDKTPEDVEGIAAEITKPYADMLSSWVEQGCATARVTLPAVLEYRDENLTNELVMIVSNVMALVLSLYKYSPPSVGVRNGVRDLIRDLVAFMDGEKYPATVLEAVTQLMEAACDVRLLNEGDVKPFLDAALKGLGVIGDAGHGGLSLVKPVAVASFAQCAAVSVAFQPSLLSRSFDQALKALGHAVHAVQEFYGNPKTEAGVGRLVQKADCHKYFQVLDRLLNIIGACIAGYEEMQDVEKTAFKTGLNAKCKDTVDILESVGESCVNVLAWYSKCTAAGQGGPDAGDAPPVLPPNIAAAIVNEAVVASVATSITTLASVAVAFLRTAEIVSRPALAAAGIDRMRPIIEAAQQSEILPLQLCFVLASNGVGAYDPTMDAGSDAPVEPVVRSCQMLASALIGLGVMHPDIEAGAQQFMSMMMQQMQEMGAQQQEEGNAGNAPRIVNQQQGQQGEDNDQEEEEAQRNLANRDVRDEDVD